MSDIKQSFPEFLNHCLKSQELSLALAQDEQEQGEIKKTLIESGFKEIADSAALMEKIKTGGQYFVIISSETDLSNLKDYYDIAVQYSSGQIEIFNKETMASLVVEPNYEGAVILLITKSDLINFQKQGFDFLSTVGLTYQA